MTNIQRFTCNMFQENTYVVSDESHECAIIDCGAYYPEECAALSAYIEEHHLVPRRLLSTHAHVDHNIGNQWVYDTYGLSPEVPADDRRHYEALGEQSRFFLGQDLGVAFPPVGRWLSPGDTIEFGNTTIDVIATPGHTPGSSVFRIAEENLLFTGDTLFRRSIGRTDLEGGSMMQLIQSLRSLVQLPDETIVLPGHGERTTIGEELQSNPFIDR